jgi:hypothetical protein
MDVTDSTSQAKVGARATTTTPPGASRGAQDADSLKLICLAPG